MWKTFSKCKVCQIIFNCRHCWDTYGKYKWQNWTVSLNWVWQMILVHKIVLNVFSIYCFFCWCVMLFSKEMRLLGKSVKSLPNHTYCQKVPGATIPPLRPITPKINYICLLKSGYPHIYKITSNIHKLIPQNRLESKN